MALTTTLDAFAPYDTTVVDFESLAALDGEQFGFAVGQPYSNIGLTFAPASVRANTNLSSSSRGVAIRSDVIYTSQYTNFLSWSFASGQRAVGFFYRDTRALSISMKAFGADDLLLEEHVIPVGEGFAGVIRRSPDVRKITLFAPHATFTDADQSRTFVDDLCFGSRARQQLLNAFIDSEGKWTPGRNTYLKFSKSVKLNGVTVRIHETSRSGTALLSPQGRALSSYGDAEVYLKITYADAHFEYLSAPLHTSFEFADVQELELNIVFLVGNAGCEAVFYRVLFNAHCIYELV
jgi:hypothetical protein